MTISRRGLMMAGATGLVTAGTVGVGLGASREDKASIRLAHITDVHITDHREAPQGVAKMFANMFHDSAWQPELVLNTGDSVMAVDGRATGASAAEQIAAWNEAVEACPVPITSCLGNHDVWNGNSPTDAVPISKKGFDLMVEVLGMPSPYYSFDHGGWHFVVLNSVCKWPEYASLDEAHFAWLKKDLAKNDLPTVVLSHIPILSVTSQVYGDSTLKGNDNVVPGTWHHADCWAITELFRHHPEVKLCLSGHMHTQDFCQYRGVTYICGGAVSGSWWNGSDYGFPPCYGKLDLYQDGTFNYDFVDYGWKAREWRGKQLEL